MKNRCVRLKKLMIFLICASMLSGCALNKVTPMEIEEVPAVDLEGDGDVMPIYGFYGPYTSYINRDGNTLPDYIIEEKYYEMMADAGLNLITYCDLDYTYTPDLVRTSLDLCDKYGLGYMVYDSTITNEAGNEYIDASALEERIAEYSGHPAFRGLHLVDEPASPDWFPEQESKYISKIADFVNVVQDDLGVFSYISLHGGGAKQGDSKERYERYVTEYCETIKAKFLGGCGYLFHPYKTPLGVDSYFFNLDTYHKYSQKYNIPFWFTAQAGSQFNDEKEHFDSKDYWPTEGQFNWNVNTILAFGAKGIGYFPIIQPEHFAWAESTEWDSHRSGLIGTLGNKTMWFNFAKNINKHIAAIDEVLMNSSLQGIIINSEQAAKDTKYVTSLIESGEFQELKSVSGDAMIGCFNYNGKTALYVVNYSMEYAQHITLHLNKKHEVRMIQSAEESQVEAKKIKLDMAAGEGVLLVIE